MTEKANAGEEALSAPVCLYGRSMMWQEHPQEPKGGVRRSLHLLAAAAFGLTLAGASAAAAQDHDPALTRTSDQGRFQVQISSDVLPIPMRRIHAWTVRISDRRGHPVDGAEIAVTGGMPEHHHGLPTQPRVAPTGNAGVYRINGVRFSMTGWWVLNLAIHTPDGRTDTVTFNVTL